MELTVSLEWICNKIYFVIFLSFSFYFVQGDTFYSTLFRSADFVQLTGSFKERK